MSDKAIQHLSAEAALAALASSHAGLSNTEAARRLIEFGPNRIEKAPRPWIPLVFLAHFTHFFALVLWLAAALAFAAEWLRPGEGMALLGSAILGVILINGSFSFAQEYRASRAIEALQGMLPAQVVLSRQGELLQLAASDLVPGDIVLVAGGDHVPADCRLIEAFGVRVNNATVTGESLPRSRTAAPAAEDDLLSARNILLAGTSLVAGEARALVFATGARTEFGRIATLTQETPKLASPLQREIARLSRWIAVFASALGLLFFVLGMLGGIGFWGSFLFAIGSIVANVPEGLLPTLTLALALGAQRMAARNALIRNLPSVETLGAATVICTDKTGTLTENRLRVSAVVLGAAVVAADAPVNGLQPLLEVAAHCHSLRTSGRGSTSVDWHGDPLEVALSDWAVARGLAPAAWPRIDELPFDSERRRMSTLHAGAAGNELLCKGALEVLLPLCSRILRDGAEEILDPEARAAMIAQEEALARAGQRVLAFARRPLAAARMSEHDEMDMLLCGLVALQDPVRPEVPAAIAACRDAGIRVVMVTGDHPRTAEAVARLTGLFTAAGNGRVIDGAHFARMADAELQLALECSELVFARISADQKRRIVHALKRKGDVVAATGDGVNDAPALREAQIGIAMGRSGTDVAKAAADMVLLDDNFASIVAAIEEGRAVFDNIRKFLTYILSSNVPEAVPYMCSVLLGIPLPLTVLQILAVDLGTDMLPALALGAEAPHSSVMQRPPRPRGAGLIDMPLLLRAFLWLGAFEAAAAMSAYFFVLESGGWVPGITLGPQDPLYRQATSACFAAIVLMQMTNLWICRSERESVWGCGGPAVSTLVWAGLGVELVCLLGIVWTPAGNMLFATAPIGPAPLLLVAPFALVMLAAEETRKWVGRRRYPRA